MQTYTHHTLHDEIRERAKFDGTHLQGEDEHMSQPSTMHSLGNLEDHFSSNHETPSNSSKIAQFGQHIKQEFQSQASNIKSMLLRTFGEMVDTSKDNSETTKQQVRKVNQEIKQLPKREEKVVEAQGRGDPKEESLKDLSSQAFAKINEMRDRIFHYAPNIKQFKEKLTEDLGESVDPSKDLDEKVKEQLNKLNQDIKKLPCREEKVVEAEGRGKEEQQESKGESKTGDKDLWDIAFHKIEEMKQKAHQKSQEFKQHAEMIPHKPAEAHPHHEHHHLFAGSQSFQPSEHSKILAETVQKGLKDPSMHLIEEIEEVENQWKHEHEDPKRSEREEKPQGERYTELKSEVRQRPERNIEEKRSRPEGQAPKNKEVPQEKGSEMEKPREREPLLDKVLNRIHTISDNIHNTMEEIREAVKIEEEDQKSQVKEEVESMKKREPLLDKVLNRMHTISDNIHHKVEDIRDALHIKGAEKDLGVEEGPNYRALFDNVKGVRRVPSKIPNLEEGPNYRSLFDQAMSRDGYHFREKVFGGISHNIETVKSGLAQKVESIKGRLPIGRRGSKDSEGFRKVRSGFSKTIKEYRQETRPVKSLKSHNPFQALIDENEPEYDEDEPKAKSVAGRMKERFMSGLRFVRSKLVLRRGIFKKAQQEPQKERQPLRKRISQGFEIISNRISQNIESVKGKFRPRKDEDEEESVLSSTEERNLKDVPPARESNEIQGEQTRPLKSVEERPIRKREVEKGPSKTRRARGKGNKGIQKKGNLEGFHDIHDGFSKSVVDFQRERRGPPVISSNLFESLSGRNIDRPIKKVRKIEQPQPKKDDADKENQLLIQSLSKKKLKVLVKKEFHEISHGVSETVSHYQKEIRGSPLISSNPFDPLYTGSSKKSSAKKKFGTDITNKMSEDQKEKGQSLIQKAKKGIEKAKENVKSLFHREDKENVSAMK